MRYEFWDSSALEGSAVDKTTCIRKRVMADLEVFCSRFP